MDLSSKLKQGLLTVKQRKATKRNVNNILRIRSTIMRNLKKKDRRRKHVEI